MSNAIVAMAGKLADKFDMGSTGNELVGALKATAFKGQVSDAQMMALLAVANQYGLNPWTKEIYAFPDKNNGIVPVVGVDGWSRIINSHAQFDGIEFEQGSDYCTCTIYRKDRRHPTIVTEFLDECKRGTGPWQSHPRRMLRHKAMIQAARIAFGYVGIFDQDEAERIEERDMGAAQVVQDNPAPAAQTRTSALKDKVAAKRGAKEEPPADVDTETGEVIEDKPEQAQADLGAPPLDVLLKSIESADSVDEINECLDLGRTYTGDDKRALAKAAGARMKAITSN